MSSKTAPDRSTGHWSLATRLTIWYAGSAFLLLAVAAGILYRVLVETLDVEDKQDLAEQMGALQKILKDRPLDVAALRKEVEDESATPSFSPLFVRVLDRTGHSLVETPGMSVMLPANAFPSRPVGRSGETQVVALRAAHGRDFRGLTAVVEHDYLIQMAVDRAGDVNLLSIYRQRLALVLGNGLFICAFIGHTIARRGVRPVKEMAAAMQRIRSTTLNERIESPHLPAELSTLAATFNDMLDRLEDAFSRLSQFSADIAHELRTPINILRGEAEVALSKTRSIEEYRDVLSSSLEECQRLSRLIDSLLFLARAENPKTQIHRERLDLAIELATLREFYQVSASEAGIGLNLEATQGLTAELDRTLFQRAVGNLVENALAYTDRGGTITLTASQVNGTTHVVVADTGCGIAADQLPEIFERFHRVDGSRSQDSGGQGLGLAIVKSIATLHGGGAQISSQVGVGTRVTIQLPSVTNI